MDTAANSKACNGCGQLFESEAERKNHLNWAALNGDASVKSVICDECGELLKSKTFLERHMSQVHQVRTGDEMLFCEVCGGSFGTPFLLKQHRQESHGKRKRMFNCRHCESVFFTQKQYREHYRAVHKPEVKTFDCEHCGLVFQTRQECNLHTKEVHLGIERKFKCEQCDYSAFRSGPLKVHKRRVHGTANPHVCPDCGKMTDSRSNLKAHIARDHLKISRFKCKLCPDIQHKVPCHLQWHIAREHMGIPYEDAKYHTKEASQHEAFSRLSYEDIDHMFEPYGLCGKGYHSGPRENLWKKQEQEEYQTYPKK